MLTDRCALITGAASGLGYAFAERLAKAGANVVLNGLPETDEGARAAKTLADTYGVNAVYEPADLADADAIAAMLGRVEARFGQVDVLVNNAVVRHFAPIEAFDPAAWEASLKVNLTAVFHAVRLTLPAMKTRGWGRIVNVSSYYGFRGAENRVDYVTTKTALLGFTRAVAVEAAKSGVTCNAICPGSVLTPAIEGRIQGIAAERGVPVEDVRRDYAAERSATGRFVEMSNIADLAVFLCSDAAADITGSALPVDGGWFSQ